MRSAALLLLAAAASGQPNQPCVFDFAESGARYDLSALAAGSPYEFDNGPSKYLYSFCKYVTDYSCPPSDAPSSSLLTVTGFPGCQTSYGRAENVTASLLKEDPTAGISLVYSGGTKVCNFGTISYTRFNIQCDPKATVPRVTDFTAMPDGCGIEYVITTAQGCGTLVPTILRTLGVGWIVFGTILVTFLLYMVGGIIYKRRKYGSSGIEAIPNIDLWRAIGAKLAGAVECVTGGCGRRRHQGLDVYELAEDDKL